MNPIYQKNDQIQTLIWFDNPFLNPAWHLPLHCCPLVVHRLKASVSVNLSPKPAHTRTNHLMALLSFEYLVCVCVCMTGHWGRWKCSQCGGLWRMTMRRHNADNVSLPLPCYLFKSPNFASVQGSQTLVAQAWFTTPTHLQIYTDTPWQAEKDQHEFCSHFVLEFIVTVLQYRVVVCFMIYGQAKSKYTINGEGVYK